MTETDEAIFDTGYQAGLVEALKAVEGVTKSPTLGQQKMIAAIESLIEAAI